MKPLWDNDGPKPVFAAAGPMGTIVGIIRLALMVVILGLGLITLLAMRPFEYLLARPRRLVTPYLVQAVCRVCLYVMGIKWHVVGTLISGSNALVANHSTWLDIFVLNAATRGFFVSKSEVSAWPGIGWLARATGTVFVERKRAQARAHRDMLARRMDAGHRLIFFPEGTSTDGLRVLPFKSTLFDAFDLQHPVGRTVQPVSLIYQAPKGQDPRIYGWWGDMSFAPHLIGITRFIRSGSVTIVAHETLHASDFDNRKDLAKACGDAVAAGHLAVATQGLSSP